MTQDLTKITTPFGLLDEETQKALKECGGPWETWSAYGGWGRCIVPTFSDEFVYRQKPTPREYVAWAVIEADDNFFSTFTVEGIARQWANERKGRTVVKLTGVRDE